MTDVLRKRFIKFWLGHNKRNGVDLLPWRVYRRATWWAYMLSRWGTHKQIKAYQRGGRDAER